MAKKKIVAKKKIAASKPIAARKKLATKKARRPAETGRPRPRGRGGASTPRGARARPPKLKVPREPLERLFPWGDAGRVIRNPEIFLELVRAGVIARPVNEGDDREWRHGDRHWDFNFHADQWNHEDQTDHGDEPRRHLDDKPGGPKPHGDSGLPPGGHGDKAGKHLDEWVEHKDYAFHGDRPPAHADGPRHMDSYSDTPYEGHWDEKGPPPPEWPDHVDG